MPGDMVKPEDGTHGRLFLHKGDEQLQEAHKFRSLPTANQELAGPGSIKMRRTGFLEDHKCTCMCACYFPDMFWLLCTEEGPFKGSQHRESGV